MDRPIVICSIVLSLCLSLPLLAAAQAPSDQDSKDLSLNVVQPDFTVVNLPTTLRLPKHKSAFRVSHRFGRSLTRGSFGQAAETFFGIDDGAQIGLEYRYGIMRGLQAGLYRTSDKTIEFFGQYDWIQQSEAVPMTVDFVGTVEGLNNFHKGSLVDPEDNEYASSVGVLLSRTVRDFAAFYLQPTFVYHANTYSTAGCLEHLEHGHDLPGCATATTTGIESNTFLIGLSSRIRLRPTTYFVASWTPRAAGFRPGSALATFGIEKRAGGHLFQLNFSNSIGSTMAQTARGATNTSDWFMGFNISRKFF
ncbi:MAG TPA: DUF5777 family beta-barrel protein [Vicinamibacterales bacterium]|nr:DUF5777 family beta-barrel protein [Vicinamibacterales bacterium]